MENILLIGGFVLTQAIIVALSIWVGAKSKGKITKNSMPVVAGLIIGTLVGGSSTVGTAQLAFHYGLSAWWFTLGGGISCLVLAFVYAVPLRRTGCPTLIGMIQKEYGSKAGFTASILNSLGTFINIISQIISATAVFAVVFPSMNVIFAAAISAALMVFYVVFGGTKGAGTIGIVKAALLYLTVISCGVIVLQQVGGLPGFTSMVNTIDNPEGINFFSLFARGFNKDFSAAISLLLGVITTQTYAQAVLSGRTDRAARGGAIISAFLIPPIGAGGILVGLYMRAHASLYPGLTAKTALTTFITSHMSPLLAGVILGALLITTIGAGAGLSLGVSSVLSNDVVTRITHRFDQPQARERMGRVWIVIILALATCFSTGVLGDIILQYAFLSMGLRAAVVFCPLCAALFLPGRIHSRWALAAIITGPAVVIVGNLIGLPFDPLLLGIAAALVIMAVGLKLSTPSKTRVPNHNKKE